VLTTALLVIAALAGTGAGGVAEVARAPLPRSKTALALVAATVALLAGGVAAAVALAALPSALIGIAGVVPLLRGLRRLTSVRFREDGSAAASTVAELVGAVRSAGADPAVAYLAIVGTRAGEEVLAASIALVAMAAVASLAAPTLGRRAERWRRPAGTLAAWTLLLTGALLLVEGGTFSWLLRR
jgi:cadmium resistance protein CadD (predicted permease)